MPMLNGKANWFKVLGKPVDGYDEGEQNKQWEFDVELTPETIQYMTDLGVGDKIKKNKNTGEPFYRFVKKAYNKDGEATKPINVVDAQGEPWDRSVLVGNGSEVNVQFFVKDWEFGKKSGKRINIGGVQVWEHVPYEGGEQFPIAPKAKKSIGGETWGTEEGDEA